MAATVDKGLLEKDNNCKPPKDEDTLNNDLIDGRRSFTRMRSSMHSSTSSSSKTYEPFSSCDEQSTSHFLNTNSRNRKSAGRKCFLIDSLLEERQRRLTATDAATTINEADKMDITEKSAFLDDTNKIVEKDNECMKKKNEISIENGTNDLGNFVGDFFPADPSPSSTASSSSFHKADTMNNHEHMIKGSESTTSTSTMLALATKLLSAMSGNDILETKNVPFAKMTTTDYLNCFRMLQNDAMSMPNSANQLPICNPLLLLQLMGGALASNMSINSMAKQQQQNFLMQQQTALILRNRFAALFAANTVQKSIETGANSKKTVTSESNNVGKTSIDTSPLNINRAIVAPSLQSSRVRSGHRSLNAKKYRCDICDKTFSRSNTLITHKRIHTGEKPFQCEHCGRAFRQPGNLTRHAYTHTTVKPFVCPECNKAFNRASNLNTHMRVHNHEQPSIMGALSTAIDSSNLSHNGRQLSILLGRTAADNMRNTCTRCGQRFALRAELKSHSCGSLLS